MWPGPRVVRSDDRSHGPIKKAQGSGRHLEWISFCMRFLAVALGNLSKFNKDLQIALLRQALSEMHGQCPRLPYKCLGCNVFSPLVLSWLDAWKYPHQGNMEVPTSNFNFEGGGNARFFFPLGKLRSVKWGYHSAI